MQKAVFIDSGVLGGMCHPTSAVASEMRQWALDLHRKGTLIGISDIVDYEVRRERVRAGGFSHPSVLELDKLKRLYGTVAVCEASLLKAAEFWARLRNTLHKAGTDDARLDADVIISGQAFVFSIANAAQVSIATTNIRHFQALIDGTHIVGAEDWMDIRP